MKLKPLIAVLVLILAMAVPGAPAARVATTSTTPLAAVATPWLTYAHDNGRDGFDTTPGSFGSLTGPWTHSGMDGSVYAQPLVQNGVVYVVTENNTLYALNAGSGAELWNFNFSAPYGGTLPCGNISPVVGITGTPAIDPATNILYAVGMVATNHYVLWGYNLTTRHLDVNAVVDAASDPQVQGQRGALAISQGVVYIPYGGRAGDCGNYHGIILGARATDGASLYNFTTDGSKSGIWSPGGETLDGSGNVYASIGNGSSSLSESVVKLGPNLANLDHWRSTDHVNLDNTDQDVGSITSGIVGLGYLFQVGKSGIGYLINPAGMGVLDSHQVCPSTSDAAFGSVAYLNGIIYVPCDHDGLYALTQTGGTFAPSWHALSSARQPTIAGNAVWTVSGGTLYALNLTTGATLGSVAVGGSITHFASPAAGGGRVFVATGSSLKSWAYTAALMPPTVTVAASPTTTKFNVTISATYSGTLSSFDLIQFDDTLNTGWYDVAPGIRAVSSGANTWTATTQVNGFPGYAYRFEARSWTYDGTGTAWSAPASATVSSSATYSHQFKALYTVRADALLRADDSPPLYTDGFSPGSDFARAVHALPGANSPQAGAVLGSNAWLYTYGAGRGGALSFNGLRYSGGDVGRDFAFLPDGTGGYVLTLTGELIPFGVNGHAPPPAAVGNPRWTSDVGRKVVIFSDGTGGYVLDYTGVPNPFGIGRAAPPMPSLNRYWPDQDFARGIALIPGTHDGYVMNAWGGLYPFRVGADPFPTVPAGYPYWPGHDIARAVWLLPSSTSASPGGHIMDCNGGLSQFGTAAASGSPTPTWSGCILAKDLAGA